MGFKPLPIGIDDFGDLISHGYYYVDKTMFIKELLDMRGKVNLFTRPRRFGKTLNMSMLQYFFENTSSEKQNESNKNLFNGLKIMDMGEKYLKEMNTYPVISISLKAAKQPDMDLAVECLKEEISKEFKRHLDVMEALKMDNDRRRFLEISNCRGEKRDYVTALSFLTECLYGFFNKKVILLIDEYDVPLENAYFNGFYDEMIHFIRSLFESAFKTNPFLEFAVVSGCLRISRESIFTGMNNLEMISILNEYYGEHFGFIQSEVDEMIDFYDCSNATETTKEWYDGYRFGRVEVYNPWSVINYMKALYINKEALPAPYWANTSSNSIVKELIESADLSIRAELEGLLAGGSIEKQIHEDITYADIHQSKDSLWNFLFFTGYLKQMGMKLEGINQYVTMKIPNIEVRYIYENMIMNWFQERVNSRDLSVLYQAVLSGNAECFQTEITKLLMESISYMDSREMFYHGFLLGTFGNLKDYIINSNREAGLGRFDILVRSPDVKQAPALLELKVSATYNGLESACDIALKQIEEKRYDEWLFEEGYREVLLYGIAFYKKQCHVKCVKKNF